MFQKIHYLILLSILLLTPMIVHGTHAESFQNSMNATIERQELTPIGEAASNESDTNLGFQLNEENSFNFHTFSEAGFISPKELDTEETQFLVLINQYRNQNGLPSLVSQTGSESASEWMSRDMGYKNYFSHIDSMGRNPGQRMNSRGYYPNAWGENIAAGQSSADGTFTLWKNSPGHNANMLSPSFHTIGIGRFYNAYSTYKWYWTTDFGDK